MQYFFVKVQHDKGFDYYKTTSTDRETLISTLPTTLNCPPSAIIQVVRVYQYEFNRLPASTIATSSGLFKLVIDKCNTQRGAPLGRPHTFEVELEGWYNGKAIYKTGPTFDRKVKLDSGGYDSGGAYWGIGEELRVTYNKELTYVHFYRKMPTT